jgi:uncharacterized membrane protein (DUF441 family)
MELPAELQPLLVVALGAVATFVITQLAKVGINLSGYNAQLTAALVSAALVLIKAVFDKVPADFQSAVFAALQFALVLFGSFGVYKVFGPKK